MQDAITSVINSSDVQGKYLDTSAMEKAKATKLVNCGYGLLLQSAPTAAIVKEAVASLCCTLTSGRQHVHTRRYAACIRDLDYYLLFYLCNAGR